MTSSRAFRLFLLFLLAYLCVLVGLDVFSMRSGRSGGELINGDAKGYYSWLRSVAIDHDVDFRNDFALIYPPETPPPIPGLTPKGLVPDKYPVGVALLEVPGFVVGHLTAKILGEPTNGISAPYQFAIAIWLQVVGVLSFAALCIALVRLGADEAIACLVAASGLLCTNLIQYIARPAWSHGPGVFAFNFAILLMVLARSARHENRRMVAAGALLGLVLIIRLSNIALAPFVLLALMEWFERWRSHLGRLALGATPLILLHFLSIWVLWGSLHVSGYGDEGFTSGWRGIPKALFAQRHGLFIYHPWYLLALGCCVAAARRTGTRRVAAGALASFVAFACINGTWWSWWFGDSFGNRAFIELIPALTVPAVLWLSSVPALRRVRRVRAVAATVAVLAAANLTLWTGYVLRRFPPDGLHTVGQAYLWPIHPAPR